MSSLELSGSFVEVAMEQHRHNPKLRLETDLKQVNTVLVSYTEKHGTTLEKLSILHVCVDSQNVHPLLIEHINSRPGDERYKGQHISRLKKIIRNLPWHGQGKRDESMKTVILEDHLPRHLREVWFLLPRIEVDSHQTMDLRRKDLNFVEYKRYRASLPITPNGLAIGSALIKVSSRNKISKIKSLLEEHSGLICEALCEEKPHVKTHDHKSAFYKFRKRVRVYLGYTVENKPIIRLRLDALQEPLQSQLRTYIDRARHGFNSDRDILKIAKVKYGLEIVRHSENTITNYLDGLLYGLGRINHEMSVEVTDVRDLLRLQTKEVEVDGVTITELYNPLVECYRDWGLNLASDRKEEGFDTGTFKSFINGLAAVAAFNGFLPLRQLFLKEYKVRLDKKSKERRKAIKKTIFDRVWLNSQVQRLKAEFHNIVNAGNFKNAPGGLLSIEARKNLNLCLFYVALLTLRFLGVRQGSLRDCILGENITFGAHKQVTFQWPRTKNGKGIRHRLQYKEHSNTHAELIDAVCIYHKRIYPYISGLSSDAQMPAVCEERKRRVAGRFFLCCDNDGLCARFKSTTNFYAWFTSKAELYMDLSGAPIGFHFNPHFLRAMFGDWLRLDLGFSSEQAAEIAADSEEVFESEYVTHPAIFDATSCWTVKNKEIVAANGTTTYLPHADVIERYERENAEMRKTINTMAETIKRLANES